MNCGTRPHRQWKSAAALPLLVAGLCGCADQAPAIRDRAPALPAADEPGFRVAQHTRWMLVGDALTPADDVLELGVAAPPGVEVIDAFVGDLPGVRMRSSGRNFQVDVDVSSLGPGAHDVVLAADGAELGFAHRVIRRSHPLYVVVSNDWDDPDNSQQALDWQRELHAEHPELRVTHFVGPYTFTDETVSAGRRAELVAWLTDLRDREGDEIGLHIHPYCSFVVAAGVPCRTEPSSVYFGGDESGYTVLLAAYLPAELDALFATAGRLFAEHGLDRPTSFRAGGWIADREVLAALARAGHVADTSANNWRRMEEWEGVQNDVLWTWNMTHWSSIGDTSQPYYPSNADVQAAGDDPIGILEVPDNGILVDYVTGREMIEIFDANFDGQPLPAPVAYSIGYHPSSLTFDFVDRLHSALRHVDEHLAAHDRGPAVYARLSDLAAVWPAP